MRGQPTLSTLPPNVAVQFGVSDLTATVANDLRPMEAYEDWLSGRRRSRRDRSESPKNVFGHCDRQEKLHNWRANNCARTTKELTEFNRTKVPWTLLGL